MRTAEFLLLDMHSEREIAKCVLESSFVIFHRPQSSTHHPLSRQAISSLTHLRILSDLSNRSVFEILLSQIQSFLLANAFSANNTALEGFLCLIELWNQDDSQLQKNIWLLWEGCSVWWDWLSQFVGVCFSVRTLVNMRIVLSICFLKSSACLNFLLGRGQSTTFRTTQHFII